MIGFNRRFDPNFAQVREVVEAGEIGEPHENGVLGSIDNSRQAVYGYDQRVEVFGSKGTVSADWYGWMRSVRKAYGVDGGMLPSMRFAVCADVASMRSRAR
jgi:predicted dehydrogenase